MKGKNETGSSQIEAEIAGIEAKRQLFSDDLQKAETSLNEKRAGLLERKTSAAEVAAAMAAFTPLKECMATLDLQLEDAGRRLSSAQLAEQEAARLQRVAELKKEREQLEEEAEKVYTATHAALSDGAEKLAAIVARADEITNSIHHYAPELNKPGQIYSLPVPTLSYSFEISNVVGKLLNEARAAGVRSFSARG